MVLICTYLYICIGPAAYSAEDHCNYSFGQASHTAEYLREQVTAVGHTLVLFAALLLVFALLLGRGVLVLLVLGDKAVHVRLGLGELHLIHALARVPMQEGLTAEHGSELLCDALHHFLHACRVADEADRHLEPLGPH